MNLTQKNILRKIIIFTYKVMQREIKKVKTRIKHLKELKNKVRYSFTVISIKLQIKQEKQLLKQLKNDNTQY